MIYSKIVESRIRQSFDDVNHHRWLALEKAISPVVNHRFLGDHAVGGERNDRDTLKLWFTRLWTVLPNLHLTVNRVWVKGWPWNTTVIAQWDGAATLADGGGYRQHAVHLVTLRWGRIVALDVFEDSQEIARALAVQASSGIEEAALPPLTS
jgi:ketosteroid isomerase-like protein